MKERENDKQKGDRKKASSQLVELYDKVNPSDEKSVKSVFIKMKAGAYIDKIVLTTAIDVFKLRQQQRGPA